MSKRRIAKNTRPVKGAKPQKTVSAPRYTIRKDSLGRRYAIDKRTGQRVPTSKADNERARRRKASIEAREQLFRGIPKVKPKKVSKLPKAKTTKKKRSEAAKKGWETRRQHKVARVPIADVFEGLIPPEVRTHVAGGIADRSEIYPKVKDAAELAWNELQLDAYTKYVATLKGQKPEPRPLPHFDQRFGALMGDTVRTYLASQARTLQDIDDIVEELANDPENDYTTRELYTLYFSPEVA
jgi:hypothetical protein